MSYLDGARLRRLVTGNLLRSSTLLFLGGSSARLLGFLFAIVAARLLEPGGFGLMAYAIAIASIGSAMVVSSPQGLSRRLARAADKSEERNAAFSSWVVVVGVVLGASLLCTIPLALVVGIRGWLLGAVLSNLLGAVALETFREVQRGLQRFAMMAAFYNLANLLQILAILAAAGLGWRSPALFVTAYGLSAVAALIAMEAVRPTPLRFDARLITAAQLRSVLRFVRPMLLQTIFFGVWFSADLVLVRLLLPDPAAGEYAAAKTAANVFLLAPGAIAAAWLPRLARVSLTALPAYLWRVLVAVAGLTLPLLASVLVFGGQALTVVFGPTYNSSREALPGLAVGMALYAVYLIFETVWLALARPRVDTVVTGIGMAVTVIAGILLVPRSGLVGASVAFATGAAVKLSLATAFTAWALRGPRAAAFAHPDAQASA